MKKLASFALSLCLLALVSFGQTVTTPTTAPQYIAGAGVTFFNPGVNGTVDVDVHVTGIFYAHTAIGNIVVNGGQLFATFRPGAEARVYTAPNGLVGLTLEGDGGIALGSSTTLSSFTTGGYAWLNVCQAAKGLQKFGNCYLELGGAIEGGSVISSTSTSAIQLVPSVKFRWGSSN